MMFHLLRFCFIAALEMYLHQIDVQQEHSTSTQGKSASMTAR